jgi:hypothetical protein
LQIPDQAQPPEEDDPTSKRQAFTMLKHRCSALLTFTMLKHHCSALLTFHDAETPLFNTLDLLPDAETPPMFNTFTFFLPLPKTTVSPPLIFSLLKHQTHTFSFPLLLLKHHFH